MMRDLPLVLILDEPTSSLDAETEHQLFERYAEAARRARAHTGAITILVSHRFSTVRAADLIVVVDQGCVVEAGSHRDLMSRGGLYAELFTLQAKPTVDPAVLCGGPANRGDVQRKISMLDGSTRHRDRHRILRAGLTGSYRPPNIYPLGSSRR